MTVLLGFAFLSGIITILSPCILPVLPLVLSGSIGRGRARPFGVIAGFVASFTFFTLALSAIVTALGIPPDTMRYVAVALILVFGLVMLVPGLTRLFERAAAKIAALGQGGTRGRLAGASPSLVAKTPARAAGFWSGLSVGLSLGLVWTPCVGPIMASVISLSLTRRIDGGSVLITLAYTLGTSIPMLAIMLGGRSLLARVPALSRNAGKIQRGFGVLMIALGITIGLGYDRRIQAAILAALPSYGTGLTAVEQTAPVQAALAGRRGGVAPTGSGLGGSFTGAPDGVADDGKLGDYGLAPALVAQGPWFNTGAQSAGQKTIPTPSPALLPAELRGKVILVDFWTYSCVNCVRTLPYLRAWYETYKDRGFVIIGVHSPEFEFEKVSANVARAMRDLGVSWPVVQDNDYAQWNAYGNKYWPAHYFIDAKGQVRYFHFGEGGYDIAEGVIKALLKEAGAPVGAAAGGAAASGAATTSTSVATAAGPVLEAQTPETYLGYERGRGLRSAITPVADKAAVYTLASGLANGEWSLQGGWTVTGQYIRPEGSGSLEIDFHSKDLFLVVEPEDGYGSLVVSLDGKPGPDTADVKGGVVKPQASRLYHLVALPKGGEHLLRLDVRGKLRLFAFTFG